MPHQPADSLFRDDRHLRGDLRRVRAAIRKGWLDGATQEYRDAIVKAFEERVDPGKIMLSADADEGTFNARFRRLMAGAHLMIDMERVNQCDREIAVDAALGIKRRGRPRKRIGCSASSGGVPRSS